MILRCCKKVLPARLRLTALVGLVGLVGLALPAYAIAYRVLISTPSEELRAARLVVQGHSTLPATATAQAHAENALAQAIRQAIAMVREDLESKIRQRALDLALSFPGQVANATRLPEEDDAVRHAATYLYRVDELGTLAGQGQAVEVELEITYTLTRNATAHAATPADPAQLPLLPAQGGAQRPVPGQDRNASRETILRLLEQGADSLRDGLQ